MNRASWKEKLIGEVPVFVQPSEEFEASLKFPLNIDQLDNLHNPLYCDTFEQFDRSILARAGDRSIVWRTFLVETWLQMLFARV